MKLILICIIAISKHPQYIFLNSAEKSFKLYVKCVFSIYLTEIKAFFAGQVLAILLVARTELPKLLLPFFPKILGRLRGPTNDGECSLSS